MARCDTDQTRLGVLLTQQGLLPQRELDAALCAQRGSREQLGKILVRQGAVSRNALMTALARQKLIRLASVLGALLLSPATTWGDSNYSQNQALATSYQEAPTTDRPPIYEGDPISVPVKALVERLTLGAKTSSEQARRFRYDIDTLGQGMALRLQVKF